MHQYINFPNIFSLIRRKGDALAESAVLITGMHLWFKSKCAPAQSSVLHVYFSQVWMTTQSAARPTLWMVSSCWEHYMTALNHTCRWVASGDAMHAVGCHLWDSVWMQVWVWNDLRSKCLCVQRCRSEEQLHCRSKVKLIWLCWGEKKRKTLS